MTNSLLVARDLLYEAATRKWILGVLLAISAAALLLGFSLQMEVVDGVLAGTRLFGAAMSQELRATDLALRPAFQAFAWTVFIGGLLFGVLSCSDFAPELLTPGRIEQLLALPVARWQLILGTYLGVMAIALAGTSYAAAVFTVLLGMKSGVWSMAILAAALAACVAFSALYGAMLAAAVFVRSASLSAALGGLLLAAGLSLTTPALAALFERGLGRQLFILSTCWLPRFWLLGHFGPAAAGFEPMPVGFLRAGLGTVVFGLACLALATWQFERKDF